VVKLKKLGELRWYLEKHATGKVTVKWIANHLNLDITGFPNMTFVSRLWSEMWFGIATKHLDGKIMNNICGCGGGGKLLKVFQKGLHTRFQISSREPLT